MKEEDQRQRLGSLVASRREDLGLSVPRAAEIAGVDRETWRNLEAGTRALRTYNRAPVERTLRWKPGSIKEILAGGEPTPLPETSKRVPRDEAEELILAAKISPEQKKRALERYHQRKEELNRRVLDDLKWEIEGMEQLGS